MGFVLREEFVLNARKISGTIVVECNTKEPKRITENTPQKYAKLSKLTNWL